jgi:flagellum-specific peptidoglycan hydrolase FlgJ
MRLLLIFSLFTANPYSDYISEVKLGAQILEYITGVPTSIQLAQAIYESAGGKSNIAKKANNHFGIRCGDNWNGERYKSRSGCWRKYSSALDSYIDHAAYLQHYYPNACGKDWQHWVKYCKGYGGANYWQKIGKIIKQYNLDKYDKAKG